MEEVITEEEQQGEEVTNDPFFPWLEQLQLRDLPKLGHFFLTKRALEFPFLNEVRIFDCPEMKMFVQQGSVSTPSLERLRVDYAEVKVVDFNKAKQKMFNSKVSCPNLKILVIRRADSITTLWSHHLPIGYFSKLERLEVDTCGKLRNLMSPSVARGFLNLRILQIVNCQSMEEVITEEEQQGEEATNDPLFPRLELLQLRDLPKLGHFFLTKRALKFPFLNEVNISDCPEIKTFVQQGYVSTPSLERLNVDDVEVDVVDLNKATQEMFNSKVSCPGLGVLVIKGADSITALWSHHLPIGYFSILEELEVDTCGKLRNLMSPSVARGFLNLRILKIVNCQSMEEVITEEEQQGEEVTNDPLFPWLEQLHLRDLPKLGHFFLTKRALEFSFLNEVRIFDCPEMKTFVQQGHVSTQSLERLSVKNVEVEVVDFNKATQEMFNSKVSCPGLGVLVIKGADSITSLWSHHLPIGYFSILEELEVDTCEKLRNLMSPSVARGFLNLKKK